MSYRRLTAPHIYIHAPWVFLVQGMRKSVHALDRREVTHSMKIPLRFYRQCATRAAQHPANRMMKQWLLCGTLARVHIYVRVSAHVCYICRGLPRTTCISLAEKDDPSTAPVHTIIRVRVYTYVHPCARCGRRMCRDGFRARDRQLFVLLYPTHGRIMP